MADQDSGCPNSPAPLGSPKKITNSIPKLWQQHTVILSVAVSATPCLPPPNSARGIQIKRRQSSLSRSRSLVSSSLTSAVFGFGGLGPRASEPCSLSLSLYVNLGESLRKKARFTCLVAPTSIFHGGGMVDGKANIDDFGF